MEQLDLQSIVEVFRRAGVIRLYAKRLAENDNSKNQIYLGGSFDLLNLLPFEAPSVVPSAQGRSVIHAKFPLSWLRDDGSIAPAPNTKLILYPQYPEVRLSGFLKGAADAPSGLLTTRESGRVLFLGVTGDRKVVGRAFGASSTVCVQLAREQFFDDKELLAKIPFTDEGDRRDRLLAALLKISQEQWIDSIRLDREGSVLPCLAQNCGGYTLEARLGVRPNSRAEPDFEGYEVKQFGVRDFRRFAAKSPVTLFTPEPTIGVYSTEGVAAFVRRYGYPDTHGRADRLNFGGRFLRGRRLERTGLTLNLVGADSGTGRISDAGGAIVLEADDGTIAAGWPFASLLEHWNTKHAEVAYVPSLTQKSPRRYRFSDTVFLGLGTSFGRFMQGVANGSVFYDPGIKLEHASSSSPKEHRRSQFRVSFPNMSLLYARFESVVIG